MSESEFVDVIDMSRQKNGDVLSCGQLFVQKKHFLSVHVRIVDPQSNFVAEKKFE